MWTGYFNLIKFRRVMVISPSHGEIDFSDDNIGIEICKELFDRGFPYLELTEMGKRIVCDCGGSSIDKEASPEKETVLSDQDFFFF